MTVTKQPSLILASRSPRRRELLALLGLPFEVTAADVAEARVNGEPPSVLVARLSRVKARAIDAGAHAIVIASDTVVALNGQILGKPRDEDEATSILRSLRGRSHAVYSAVTVLQASSGRWSTDVAQTEILMRTYTDAEVAAYVASGDPMDKAGAYAIQHRGFHPVAEFRGCHANVMGLPLCHLTRSLRLWHVEPLRDVPAACQAHTGRPCHVYPTILSPE